MGDRYILSSFTCAAGFPRRLPKAEESISRAEPNFWRRPKLQGLPMAHKQAKAPGSRSACRFAGPSKDMITSGSAFSRKIVPRRMRNQLDGGEILRAILWKEKEKHPGALLREALPGCAEDAFLCLPVQNRKLPRSGRTGRKRACAQGTETAAGSLLF